MLWAAEEVDCEILVQSSKASIRLGVVGWGVLHAHDLSTIHSHAARAGLGTRHAAIKMYGLVFQVRIRDGCTFQPHNTLVKC